MQKEPPHSVDLSGESVHWDFREAMSYGDYLRLGELLSCQRPLTDKHDETLFIVIHQASELWIKLCLHEIGGAMRQIRADELGPAFKMMARVARVLLRDLDVNLAGVEVILRMRTEMLALRAQFTEVLTNLRREVERARS